MAAAPDAAAELLVERSRDAIAAVSLDAAGGLRGHAGIGSEAAPAFAELAYALLREADGAAAEPVEQFEVAVAGGAVFAIRTPAAVLACVTRRQALPALVLYDLRRALLDAGEAGRKE